MPKLLAGLADQFSAFSYAWRWQPGEKYSGWEDPYVRQFSAGARPEPMDVGPWHAYLGRVRQYRTQGDLGRVWVMNEPPTDFQLWYEWTSKWAVEAGEDLRFMPLSMASQLGLPRYDFWLFDGLQVAIMLYSAARAFTGAILIERHDDPAFVDQHCVWRDLAIQHATQVAAGAAA